MEKKIENLPIFVGIKLTEKSREELISRGLPKCELILDHITLEFNPSSNSEILEWVNKHLGEEISFQTKDFGFDISERGSIYAIGVELGDIPCKNTRPHITVGIMGSRRPVESNYIDNWTKMERIDLFGIVYRKERD